MSVWNNTARRLLGVAAAAALAAAALAEDESEDAEVEEIVVTGSYIKGTPEDAPLPVTTLRREDLELEGSPTTIDLIKSMSFSQGADGETDQFQAGAGSDRATINIRGLGPSRSLVLLNGRRTTWSPHAIDAQAQLLVDVNMLPSIALQRIEVLRDGAAATYGSDAIAGVMNFITRGDFNGFEASVNHKSIDGSDGDTEAGVIVGGDWLGGRLRLMSSASYIQRSELPIASRDWALLDYADSPAGGWSSIGRPATFLPFGAAPITDPNCKLLGGEPTAPFFCRFQYTAFDNLIEEGKRWQWFTEASFDIDEVTRLGVELLVTDSDVPAWATSPSYPPNRLVDPSRSVRANNPGLVDMASKYPALYGRFASCDEDYCGWQGDEWSPVGWFWGRYYGQDGPRRYHYRESKLQRFAATLDGAWGDRGWQLSLTYSESQRESEGGDTMVYRDARARQGLGGLECERLVPNQYDANGNLFFPREVLERHAGQGPCRYWIPFSNSMPGAHPFVRNGAATNPDFNPALNNQDLLDYMITADVAKGETSLFVLEGVMTGALGFEMPAGAIDYAVGGQYRSETYESGVDDDSFYNGITYPCKAGPEIKNCATGRTGLFGFLPPAFKIDQDRNIWSVFGQLNVPLADNVEGQLSVRHENYGGDTGATTDPKVALKWQISGSVGVRASYGSTFRGPTLNQIVASNSSNSLQYISQAGAFKRIDTKGNPDLRPEEADTLNVGLLVDHDGLLSGDDNLFVTLDYWSYDFSDPLVTEPFANVLTLACPGGPAAPCDAASPYFGRLVFGGPPTAGSVEIININIVNGPDVKTDGVDFTFRYGMPAGGGRLSFDLSGTRITSYDIGAWEFGPAYDALGRLNYRTSLARTLAQWKGRLSANYAWNALNVRWTVNGIAEYDYLMQGFTVANCPATVMAGACHGVVDQHVTHDLHFHYSFMNDQLRAFLSVINLQDEDPPFMSREMNYDAFTHNPFGRMLKFGVSYSMGG